MSEARRSSWRRRVAWAALFLLAALVLGVVYAAGLALLAMPLVDVWRWIVR